MSSRPPSLDDLRIERSASQDEPRRAWPWILAVALVLVAGFAAWSLTDAKATVVKTAIARETVASAGERAVLLNASGYVTARREATVSSKITGKVTEVLVEEGMNVKAGQMLARLDDTNVAAGLQLAHAQLDAAKAALEETQVRLKEAEQDLQRQKQLVAGKVVSPSDYDHAEAAARAMRARLVQQQAAVVVAERTVAVGAQQLEDTVIRAPFAGIVTSKNAQPGEMISPMSSGGFTRTGICTIVDMESLEIEIDVNESYINRVQAGQPVEATLDAYPEWKIPCRVIAIIPTADRQKSTVRVRLGFEKLDPRILPEMSVKVAFQTAAGATGAERGRTMAIPRSAVRSEGGRDVVFVVRGGRVERRAVTVEGAVGENVAVRAGLSGGDSVVLEPPPGLADGAAVTEAKP
jgi:RND family efflux transporter MFP subunit